MKRREFLKLTSAAGVAATLPFYPSTKLFAAHENYAGPLYLMIDAVGGWDPTSFCDPKGPPINKYTTPIGQVPNSPIRYAPPPDSFLTNTSLYTNKQFFETHFQKLLIINGINVGTVAHSDGRRTSWSGELQKTNYPSFGALVASMLAPERDIPFIANGGYTNTADLVVPVRLNSQGVSALFEIAFPNRVNPTSATSTQYFSNQVESLINTSSVARQQALLNQQRLPRIKNAISSLLGTKQLNGHLKDLAVNLSDTITNPEKPLSFFNNRKKAHELYQQGRIALATYETEVTAAAHISMRGFDTHSDHDTRHYPLLMDYLQGVDAILQEAADRGLSDRLVVIMGSDFGRTNKYNDNNFGKDHWPITSMMLIGNINQQIQGNRVIGATTSDHKALKVDRNTLAVDTNNSNPNAITLTPAHIHRALRRLAGVDQSAAAIDFAIGGEDINLF
ncbi:MAG: DUF1501 domain-containing protein [Gammaproteobacteria bacterium]|nr:DUF1501 domain-containing protein [Gammaproteobacteria bacterium]